MLPPVSVRTAGCGASSTNGSAWGMASDGPDAPVAALRIATDVAHERPAHASTTRPALVPVMFRSDEETRFEMGLRSVLALKLSM
jgi:hypothetical protein